MLPGRETKKRFEELIEYLGIDVPTPYYDGLSRGHVQPKAFPTRNRFEGCQHDVNSNRRKPELQRIDESIDKAFRMLHSLAFACGYQWQAFPLLRDQVRKDGQWIRVRQPYRTPKKRHKK